LKSDPDFRKLVGDIDPAVDRIAGWRGDLAYFTDLAQRRHPNLFHTMTEAQWRAAAADLNQRIPQLSDAEVVKGFMHLASMVGDGHTSVYPPTQGRFAIRLLPIWPYAFGDHWTIVSAAPDHADLVGAQIVRVDGRETAPNSPWLVSSLPADNE